MIQTPRLLACALAVTALALPAAAHEYAKGSLHIAHPWARPAAQGLNGAAYLVVHNASRTADVLKAVEAPIATKVELHRSSTVNGVSSMTAMPQGLAVPARGELALAPGGAHIMLVGLKQPLTDGAKVPATLVFQNAGRVRVELAVQVRPAQQEPAHH